MHYFPLGKWEIVLNSDLKSGLDVLKDFKIFKFPLGKCQLYSALNVLNIPVADSWDLVGLVKSFKTSRSLSKSVQRFKSYKLLKFNSQKSYFWFNILTLSGGAPPLLEPMDPPIYSQKLTFCEHCTCM